MTFMDSNFLGWSAALTPQIMGNPERPELAEELNNSFCRTDPDIRRRDSLRGRPVRRSR
jgi:sigma-B regulation protein RsbQ